MKRSAATKASTLEVEWKQISALEQWILLTERDLETIPRTLAKNTEAAKKLSSQLRTIRKRLRLHSPSAAIPSSLELEASSFLSRRFRVIFGKLPLDLWSPLLSHLRSEVLPLTELEAAAIIRLSDIWRKLLSEDRRQRLKAIKILISFLADMLGWSLSKSEDVENVSVQYVKIRHHLLSLPPLVPVLVTFLHDFEEKPEEAHGYITHLQNSLRASSTGPGNTNYDSILIDIVVGKGKASRRYLELAFQERTTIPLDEEKLKAIFLSPKYSLAFSKFARHSLGLSRLNPYTPEKPVDRPDMFFGRSTEIKIVLDNPETDFLVLGSRRIGKSSLLRYLEKETLSAQTRIPIYIDCATIQNAHELTIRLAELINIRRARRIELGGLAQLITVSYSVKRLRYLFLLDEVDKLVLTARQTSDWRLFEILRTLANNQISQTVFGGYKVLFEAWKDLSSPLYNFVSPIYLTTLNEDSARKLTTQPMRALGVEYQRRSLVNDIVRETGGHPSFLQFLCSELIRTIDERGTREITGEDLASVRRKKDYRLFVLKPYEYKDNLSDLERMIILELVRAKERPFHVNGVLRMFSKRRFRIESDRVTRAFENLEIAGFFQSEDDILTTRPKTETILYDWTVPAFPTVLGRTSPVERQIGELYQRLANRSRKKK